MRGLNFGMLWRRVRSDTIIASERGTWVQALIQLRLMVVCGNRLTV